MNKRECNRANIDGKPDWNRQNLTGLLTKMENSLSASQMTKRLHQQAAMDPDNLICLQIGETAVVIGEHAIKRAVHRCFMTKRSLADELQRILTPDVVAAIAANVICYEDGKLVRCNDYYATVVSDSRTGRTFVFEAGFSFINVKTVWTNLDGKFGFSKEEDTAFTILEDGTLSFACSDKFRVGKAGNTQKAPGQKTRRFSIQQTERKAASCSISSFRCGSVSYAAVLRKKGEISAFCSNVRICSFKEASF